jgi:hypothetical protein
MTKDKFLYAALFGEAIHLAPNQLTIKSFPGHRQIGRGQLTQRPTSPLAIGASAAPGAAARPSNRIES